MLQKKRSRLNDKPLVSLQQTLEEVGSRYVRPVSRSKLIYKGEHMEVFQHRTQGYLSGTFKHLDNPHTILAALRSGRPRSKI